MYYWFRPSIHLCDSPDPDRTICGATITGASPTVRSLPDEADPVEYFDGRNAKVCGNCRRILASRRD